eukprot:2809842-Alexandrium_andersonii.AAC.1
MPLIGLLDDLGRLVVVDCVEADDEAREEGGHLLPRQLPLLLGGDALTLVLVANPHQGLIEVAAADAAHVALVELGLAEGPRLVAALLPLGRRPWGKAALHPLLLRDLHLARVLEEAA